VSYPNPKIINEGKIFVCHSGKNLKNIRIITILEIPVIKYFKLFSILIEFHGRVSFRNNM
jgi:hypothetical protein